MEVKPGYKETEAGVLPADWDVAPLGNHVRITSGESPSLLHLVASGVPYFKVEQLSSDDKYLDTYSTPYHFLHGKTVPRHSVIFAKRGAAIALNKIRILSAESFMDTNLMVLTPTEALDFEYLYYALGHIGLWRFADATSVPQINNKHIKPLPFPLPRLPEQRAISTAFSDVDALLGGLDRLIAKKRGLKQAAMQQLLTGQTRLLGFHGEWETVRLADVSAFITKGSTPTTYGFGWQPSGVLFLRSECVSPDGLDLAESMFISAEAHRVLRRSAVQPNDLLITITGNVGRVVRLPGDFVEANINQHIARIRIVDEATHPGWVYHFLSQPEVRQHFEKITTGQAYPQISLAQVRDAVIPRPAIGEQREISAALDDMDREITVLEARRDKTHDLKQAMMQELLTGKTRLVPAGGVHA